MRSLLVLALLFSPLLAQADPWRGAGALAPDAPLRTAAGEATTLRSALGGKPAVVVFYRGAWCPFCVRQWTDLGRVRAQLDALGLRLIGVSPDRPAHLEALAAKGVKATLLSDSDMHAAKAFGLAFTLDQAARKLLADHDIDVAAASGRDHFMLPHPAVYVIGPRGWIRFAHVDPKYRDRPAADAILAAAKAAIEPTPALDGLVPAAQVNEKKRLPGDRYLRPAAARAALLKYPGRAVLIDVRTPEEYTFVGHPTHAPNVPLLLNTTRWDSAKKAYAMTPNPNFVAELKARVAPGQAVILMCRSGGRSAAAGRLLKDAGLTVYNLIEGFEGGKDKQTGHRTVNGWRNAKLPWTYSVDPALVWRPTQPR